MGDFERTFGAGADASSIIGAFSDQQGRFNSDDDAPAIVVTPAERIEKARRSGVRLYWRTHEQVYGDEAAAETDSELEYFAFDDANRKNVGRIYRIDCVAQSTRVCVFTGSLVYEPAHESWGWSMYAHGPAEQLFFRTNGVAESAPEAEGFVYESYGMLMEYNRAKPRFYANLPLKSNKSIHAENIDDDPFYSEIITNLETDRVISTHGLGSVLYAVVVRGPDGNFGSVHTDLKVAIASFSAQFDGWHHIDGPARREYAPEIARAISTILADEHSAVSIQRGDAEVSLTRVLMEGPA